MKSSPVKTPPLPSPEPVLSKVEGWGGNFLYFFLSLFHIYHRFIVSGNSMSPLLHDGDVVYTKKSAEIEVSEIVVVQHPFRKKYIIKQVTAIHGDMLKLSGLNPEESEDSRTFGYIPKNDILGVVMMKG